MPDFIIAEDTTQQRFLVTDPNSGVRWVDDWKKATLYAEDATVLLAPGWDKVYLAEKGPTEEPVEESVEVIVEPVPELQVLPDPGPEPEEIPDHKWECYGTSIQEPSHLRVRCTGCKARGSIFTATPEEIKRAETAVMNPYPWASNNRVENIFEFQKETLETV